MIKKYLSSKPFFVNACKYLVEHKWAMCAFMFLFGVIFALGMIYCPQLVALLILLCYAE